MNQSFADQKLVSAGRAAVYVATFLIPVAFCRETMYIFQAKTLVLQYTGLAMLLLMVAHHLFNKEAPDFFKDWSLRLIWIFLAWQMYKTWDTIAPAISERQLTRVFWLPIVAVSVPYFFRTRAQFERLLWVIVAAAVASHLFGWAMYYQWSREALFGTQPTNSENTLFYAENIPVIGDLFKQLFYPEPFDRYARGGYFFPVSWMSFYPGKEDAGTFGNKNFFAAFTNMTMIILLYKSLMQGYLAVKKEQPIRLAVCIPLLLVFGYSYIHLAQLRNRGSQVGALFAILLVAVFLFLVLLKANKRNIKKVLIPVGAIVVVLFVMGGVFYNLQPERFKSIVRVEDTSNELRIHTWRSFYTAWAQDEDQAWPSFSSDMKRWFTGLGNYTFRAIYPKYRSPRIFQLEHAHNTETSHPHNEYVGYLGELGIIGLALYLVMAVFVFIKFLKSSYGASGWDLFIRCAVLFSVTSLFVHQGVSVAQRYTGAAFQFWLSVGLMLYLSGAISFKKPEREQGSVPRYARAGILLFAGLFAMPDVSFPLAWARSQNFYEMGQINYQHVRNSHQRYLQIRSQTEQLRKRHSQSSGKEREELGKQLENLEQYLQQAELAFKSFYAIADQYFGEAQKVDEANLESIYIGGNMNVQFARISMQEGDLEKAREMYIKALGRYKTCVQHMPYFVQSHFWIANCHMGLADYYQKKMQQTQDMNLNLARQSSLRKALEAFDHYQKQDPVLRDPYFFKFHIYSQFGETTRALNEARGGLLANDYYGYDLLDPDNRFNTLEILMAWVRSVHDEEKVKEVFKIFANVFEVRNSKPLLPMLPRTEHHPKTLFETIPVLE